MSNLPYVTSRNDVNDTLMLRHLFCFWRDLMRFNGQKDLSPLRKSLLHRNSTVARRVTNDTSEHYGNP